MRAKVRTWESGRHAQAVESSEMVEISAIGRIARLVDPSFAADCLSAWDRAPSSSKPRLASPVRDASTKHGRGCCAAKAMIRDHWQMDRLPPLQCRNGMAP